LSNRTFLLVHGLYAPERGILLVTKGCERVVRLANKTNNRRRTRYQP
jgi:hypothetical protein